MSSIELPEKWDKDYKAKLRVEVLDYLDTYFYDGPFDKTILMQEMMRETKGLVDPHMMNEFVEEFIHNYEG